MISLLEAANEYVHLFKGIRISTRPDCISSEILTLLKKYKVTAIELGAQSMDDAVLILNNRGHNSEDVKKASKLIKKYGFSLGLQMMTGLYGSNDERDIFTACEFIKLQPDTVRIYPTVILENTLLSRYYIDGKYLPQTVDNAVNLCSTLIEMFEGARIQVIRVGLHSSDTMESKILAGAYHPAFRELCENKIFLRKIIEYIEKNNIKKGKISIFVSPSAVSKAIGQQKANINELSSLGYNAKIIPDTQLFDRQIIIQEGY